MTLLPMLRYTESIATSLCCATSAVGSIQVCQCQSFSYRIEGQQEYSMAGKMGRFVPTLTMHIASEAALLRHGMEQTEPQEVAHGVHERKESDTILGMPYCGILNGACRKVSYKPYHMKVGCSIGSKQKRAHMA